jgi:predicted nucleic acid-binding protein
VDGVLLLAKQRGLLPAVAPLLQQLNAVDYRVSAALLAEALRLAGEVIDRKLNTHKSMF